MEGEDEEIEAAFCGDSHRWWLRGGAGEALRRQRAGGLAGLSETRESGEGGAIGWEEKLSAEERVAAVDADGPSLLLHEGVPTLYSLSFFLSLF